MPTQCWVCKTWSKKAKKGSKTRLRFYPIDESKYEDALRLQIRLKPRRTDEERASASLPSSRPGRVCAYCYKAIGVAVREDALVVALASAQGRDAGKGVFLMKEAPPGIKCADYDGVTLLKEEAKTLEQQTHVVKKNARDVIDGRVGRRKFGRGGLGALVNRAPQGVRPNVRIVRSQQRGQPHVDQVAIKVPTKSKGGRTLPGGTELLTTYGRGYTMPPLKERKGNKGRPYKAARPTQLTHQYRTLLSKVDREGRKQ